MSEFTPYLLAALGAILFWGAKLIVSAIAKLGDEMKQMRGELAAHNASTGERIKGLEIQVEGISDSVADIDQRLRHLELKRA